jgi:hypothetical protein
VAQFDDPGRNRVRMPRPRFVRAAVALAAAAAIALIIGVVASLGGGSSATTETATIRSGAGTVVGDATVRGENPATIVLDMHRWTNMLRLYGARDERRAVLTVTERDGTVHTVNVPVEQRASWTDAYTVPGLRDPDSIVTVAISGNDGVLWCSGAFA